MLARPRLSSASSTWPAARPSSAAPASSRRSGSDHSRLKLVVDGEVKRDVADLHIKGHGEALANIRDALAPQLPGEIAAVGHRVVHGGASILGPALVDDAIVDEVDACAALAPLHNPANALGIRFARDTWGGVPHVVVPDTAFPHRRAWPPKVTDTPCPRNCMTTMV